MSELVFPDPAGYADVATLVRRARTADPGTAVRLRAQDTTLQVWVGVLPGSGLLADGAAVGVRGGHLAEPADLDVVVAAAALTDRFAHDGDGALRLSVPPASVFAPWSGALPGSCGWASIGVTTVAQLDLAAREGISEIASGARGPVGAFAVDQLRAQVWGRRLPLAAEPDDLADPTGPLGPPGAGELPAAAAFAAYVLGFLRGGARQRLPVYRQGRWWRLRTPTGHVLVR